MAGVVRRDGLRDGCSADGVHETHVLTEELDDLRYRVDRYEFENRALLRVVAAVQDLRDECASSGKIHYEHLAVRLTAVLDAVPDVPPDDGARRFTVAELDAMPAGTVVQSPAGNRWRRRPGNEGWYCIADPGWGPHPSVDLPRLLIVEARSSPPADTDTSDPTDGDDHA